MRGEEVDEGEEAELRPPVSAHKKGDATASSGGGQVIAAPSVAALRTAGVTTSSTCNSCQQTQQTLQAQSVPVFVQEVPVALVASNKHVGILDKLRARSNTSVSKSVAITRTTSR